MTPSWSDGVGGIPNVTGDIDWGKLSLQLAGAEGRSAVYDLGSAKTRTFTLTENRYGTGAEDAALQIRGDTVSFTQDDNTVDWEDYTVPVSHGWRYVQVRETTFTYYFVDATLGDDGDAGTRAAPWQTIAKVNASTFKPDDHILFKRGETWAERLLPTISGIACHPIFYGAYGSGNKPILRFNTATYSSCKLLNVNYITLDNLDMDGTGCYFGLWLNSCHDIRINSCNMRSAVNYGAYITGPAASTYNLTFTDLSVHNNAMTGFVIGYGDNVDIKGDYQGLHDVILQDSSIYSNGTDIYSDHGVYVGYSSYNVTVRHCDIYSNTGEGIKFNSSHDALIYQNNVRLNRGGMLFSTEVGYTCGGHLIYNNLVYAQTNHGFYILNTVNNLFYHNTLVNNSSVDNDGGIIWDGVATGNIFKNNLFVQDQAVDPWTRCLKGTGTLVFHNTNTFDYNDWARIGHTAVFRENGVDYTLAQWQALSGSPDPNSINSDPVFVTNYTDLHLQTTSPCKNTGALGLGVLTDYDGVTRDATPDIGAYEYV